MLLFENYVQNISGSTYTRNICCNELFKFYEKLYHLMLGVLNQYLRTSVCSEQHRWGLHVLYYHNIMVFPHYYFLVLITQMFYWLIFINDCISILTGSSG